MILSYAADGDNARSQWRCATWNQHTRSFKTPKAGMLIWGPGKRRRRNAFNAPMLYAMQVKLYTHAHTPHTRAPPAVSCRVA